jgi:hypothetical protein
MPFNGQGLAAGVSLPATYNFATKHQTTIVPRPLQCVVEPPPGPRLHGKRGPPPTDDPWGLRLRTSLTNPLPPLHGSYTDRAGVPPTR